MNTKFMATCKSVFMSFSKSIHGVIQQDEKKDVVNEEASDNDGVEGSKRRRIQMKQETGNASSYGGSEYMVVERIGVKQDQCWEIE